MTENKRYYPDIIHVGEGCSISDSDIKIRVSYGTPLPPEPAHVEPPQLPVTEAERAVIQQELQNLASEIQDVLRDFALLMHEAAERMGLGQGWCNQPDTVARIMEWRTSLTEAAGERYVGEIRSRFIDAYEHARVRGFFDPELESHYTTRLLVAVDNHLLPGLRRAFCSRGHRCCVTVSTADLRKRGSRPGGGGAPVRAPAREGATCRRPGVGQQPPTATPLVVLAVVLVSVTHPTR